MGRERKCILCNIIYSSKREMGEHMRSMLHHRELENLKGRDCKHECRVCRVTVVGLSAYAKHISSQHHKENVETQEGEENRKDDGKEEEYFDKELIQLIGQRKEQTRKNDVPKPGNRADGDDRRYWRMREDQPMSQWHHESAGERERNWVPREYASCRLSKYHWKTNSGGSSNRRLPGSWGHHSWQPDDSEAAPNWYSNHSWHSSGPGGAPSHHRKVQGGPSNWNTSASTVADSAAHYMSSRSNARHQPGNSGNSVEELDRKWNKGKMQKLNQMDSRSVRDRRAWEKAQNWRRPGRKTSDRYSKNDYAFQECHMDFTSDDVPSEGMLSFNLVLKAQNKSDEKGGKSLSPPRDKRHRWAPYRPQRSKDLATDPGIRSKNVNESGSSSRSARVKDTETRHRSGGRHSGKVTEGSNSGASSVIQHGYSTEDEIKAANEDGNQLPAMLHAKFLPSPPPERASSASDSNPKKDEPSFKIESEKWPRSPNLGTQCSLLSKSTQGLNSAPSTSTAPLSTEATAETTVRPSLAAPGCGDKSPLDNSLNEMLRLAREALRQSQSECGQDSHPESSGEPGEGRNSNSILQNTDGDMVQQAPGDSRKLSQEPIGISEELDPVTAVSSGQTCVQKIEESHSDTIMDSASMHSDQRQSCAQTIKDQTAILGTQHDADFEVCITKGDSKALASRTRDQPSFTFSFAVTEAKNANEVQGSMPPETFDNCSSDIELQSGGTQGSNSLLSELNKLGLPTSVQRDLTRHINAKSRPGTHVPEPNLNIARRIRNIGSQKKSESEKESGLKPTVRQLLNVSRHHVNWDQVIQQVAKKKQELGKGLPRFGIEMVPSVQTSLEALQLDEEKNFLSLEGFQWEGISNATAGSIRKRSLSESSVVTDKRSIYNLFGDDLKHLEEDRAPSIPSSKLPPFPPGPNTSTCQAARDSPALSETLQLGKTDDNSSSSTQELPTVKMEGSIDSHIGLDSIPVKNSGMEKGSLLSASDGSCRQGTLQLEEDGEVPAQQSSSGAVPCCIAADGATDSSYTSGGELNDTQVLGKRRRATADGLSPELHGLERNNKRRKIKSKRERSQLEQLLSISLREDELNKTSQGLDGNLLQARSALQAAYIEVQKLLLLKQQISLEMNTLRTKRIEILQGLQDSNIPSGERLVQSPVTENGSLHRSTCELSFHIPFSSLLHPPSCSGSTADLHPPFQAAPGFQVATENPLPVSIKQEPVSPKRIEENMKMSAALTFAGQMLNDCHGSAPLQGAHSKGEVTSTGFPIITLPSSLQHMTEGFPPLGHREEAVVVHQTRDHNAKTGTATPVSDQRSGAEPATYEQRELFAVPENHNFLLMDKHHKGPRFLGRDDKSQGSELQQEVESSIIPSDSKSSKKKKKFRKKKSRAAQAGENSDTEQDAELIRPQRKLKNKKVTKAKVTTSTHKESDEPLVFRTRGCQKEESKMRSASTDSDSSVELLEVSNPTSEVVAIESLESGNERPDSPPKRERAARARGSAAHLKAAYDEVTSTSEIGTSCTDVATRSVAETQTPVSSQKESRNTSEMSSDDGEEEDPTEGVFESHQAAVNAMQIHSGQLYTCSADKTVRVYSLTSRQCVGTFEPHSTKVNCLLIIQLQGKTACLYTGSSDHTVRCYDVKTKVRLDQFTLTDRVLSLHSRWRILYIGLANGAVFTFSVKTNKQLDMFECHGPRAVSCLATAQEGARRLLLVGSYDCTISVRDARNGLLLRTLEGHTKTVLCMKVINDLVFSGSSDQSVHAHNIHTGELVRVYKGHSHAVTVVNILGKVMVTACLDKLVRVYELQSHDRLQVYGGHKDMVMCMVIHKSMIYTGCYDGSIQAVRLNLMQNYRCWWTGCSLIFGVLKHLKHHLLTEHNNNSVHTLKCRWRNCDAFFTLRNGSKQEFPKHLCQHAEENSHLDP
ncbi:zinc finger protein 106 isoform X1 [Mobula hypostoma]|uniref:zinc finger protein 106 isoform X1 n=2 Tax=Mobula hypostoma TaxID=723540 RepID=UPI002FC3C690